MTLKTQGLQTLEQVRDFLAGSAPLDFAVVQRPAAYGFVAAQLGRFDYRRLGKAVICGARRGRVPRRGELKNARDGIFQHFLKGSSS